VNLNNIHSIYFLGIGGIGMSGLARYFHSKGLKVWGYDRTQTPLTSALEIEGIPVHYSDDPALISDSPDLVIFTPAIPADNREFLFIKEMNYPVKKRAEVLGMLAEGRFTIAVAGTHGKTSITSIVAHILKSSGCNVTAFIGGVSRNYNSNVIISQPAEIMLAEADEYDRSFLNLMPDIAVITSMDPDHLDIYGTEEKLRESFMQFAGQIKPKGRLIIKKGLPLPQNVINIIYSDSETCDAYARNIGIQNNKFIFDIVTAKDVIPEICFSLPGRHNVENAVAAASVAVEVGIDINAVKLALESYKGVERRFDYRINSEKIVYIDDYAHHPRELKACISAVKELYAGKKITCIFQPHLYSRTRDLADGFADALQIADELILLDIYPARELPIRGVTSELIFRKVNLSNKIMCRKEDVLDVLKSRKLDVLLTLGAGDIDTLVKPIELMFNDK
jgi:UDP-N-acetylmuramate--alanine ligase